MEFEKHCQETLQKLGNRYEEVHIWLDYYYQFEGVSHREKRHHTNGVKEVEKLFGKEAGKAAVLHIKSDLCGDLPTPEEWKDADYWLSFFR